MFPRRGEPGKVKEKQNKHRGLVQKTRQPCARSKQELCCTIPLIPSDDFVSHLNHWWHQVLSMTGLQYWKFRSNIFQYGTIPRSRWIVVVCHDSPSTTGPRQASCEWVWFGRLRVAPKSVHGGLRRNALGVFSLNAEGSKLFLYFRGKTSTKRAFLEVRFFFLAATDLFGLSSIECCKGNPRIQVFLLSMSFWAETSAVWLSPKLSHAQISRKRHGLLAFVAHTLFLVLFILVISSPAFDLAFQAWLI